MSIQVNTFENLFRLSKAVAEKVLKSAQLAVDQRGRFLLVLCGGKTPLEMYGLLAESPYVDELDWTKVHFFWSDERCVSPESSDSNYHQAMMTFIEQMPVPLGHIHRILGERGAEVAAIAYEKTLLGYADLGQSVPVFDLILLGLGEDGHTASLFPGSSLSENGEPLAIPAFGEYQGRPVERVTLTPRLINAAREIVFLVAGQNKAAAVHASIKGERDLLRWPAQRIAPLNGELIWMLNKAASLNLE